MPTIAAANTLNTTAYKTACGESWNENQKGRSAASGSVAMRI